MRTVTYRVTDENRTICLGKVDENNATQIRFDAEDIFAEYPSAIPTLSVINPEGVVYPAIVNRDGNVVTWNVQDSDVATEGTGEIQLAFTAGSNVVRSFIYTTRINRSIVSDDVPDPVDDWLTEAGTALYTIEHMTASAEGLPAGSEPTAEYQDGNIAFGIPKGEKGDPGTDGHSPVITAEKSGKITTVSVDGETIATINDGEDGTDGVTPNLIAGTTTTGAAGTSASVTRRAGSPDSAPIFDFTIPKGDKGDHGDLQLDSTLTSASAAAPADQVGNLKRAINNNLYKSTGNMLDFGAVGGTWQQGGYNNTNPYQCKTKIDIAEGKTVYGVINNSKMIKTSALSSYTLAMYIRAFNSSDIQLGDEVLLSASSSQVTTSFTTPQNTSYVLIVLSSGAWGNQFTPSTLDNAVEAFAYVGYDNISYTDVSPNLTGYPEYNNKLIQKTDDKIDALESTIPSMKDIESIAGNGYKTLSQFPAGTKYDWSNTSTALSPDDKISNAYKLNKCALEIATAGTFKVGLYTASGTTATVTHVKEITAVGTGVTEFDLDFLLDPTKEYYFFVLAVSGAFKFSAVTTTDKYFTIPSSAVSVGGTGTITTASGNGLALGTYNIFLNVTVSGKANTVTVAKSGGDYSTIQEAVNNTTTETIIVYPGIYDEVVIVPNSGGRNIIGVDREKCVIRSKSGKYADAPLKIYGNFYLANMTLIATAEDAGTWYPTWDTSDPTTFASYAIHIDGWTNDWNGAKGIVRNCTFYSECNHAAGCGVQMGYTLEFENCEFIRNVTDSNYINSNYDGAMGVHSPNVDDTGATGEHLIMRDCTVVNKNHTKALQLFDVFLGAKMDAEIKGCTFKDSAGIDNVIKYWNCSSAMITDMSHGNSTDECNYRAIHA